MKAFPTVDNLQPVLHNQIPVITTELLARLYGTEAIRIQQNHHENKTRFIEGKHFFKAVGDELKNLRLVLNESQNEVQISPKTRSLILWTERGAARHAKMLETDQAWEVFERLEDCYFNSRESSCIEHDDGPDNTQRVIDALYTMPEHFITAQNGKLITTSMNVAEAFAKQHKHVVQKIMALECGDEFLTANFSPVKFIHRGNEYTAYRMTKDGFMLLVMGFTGKKAMAVKIAYINAFNEMAKQLQQQRDKEARKKLTEQAAIAARSSKEHERLLTQPDYRQEVLKELDRVAGKGNIPFNLNGMVREQVVSALLLDLLRNARALVSFDERLNPQITIVPATGLIVDPFDHDSVINLAKSSLSTETLQDLIKLCADKLAQKIQRT
ncbi:Rha family transcriptional regulator [Enterobacter cloacae]|nr:Rha family transcriptional regulator [Enterobacter cloacae]